MSSIAGTIAQLLPAFAGRVLMPADQGYDDARRVHNGLVDKRPAVIAQCRGVADIVDAVNTARKLNLEIAVRGGGHNVAGRGTVDGGLLVDLSLMKGIHVDPKTRTARAQGGVLWREFNRDTQLHGLATTGGVVSTTGISGLTLGGGLGWLMTKYGLALDNLEEVELVMADGQVMRASADENPDLFWAVRGGGGNFGIAASLKYRLHPVGPMVYGGMVAHPVTKAREVFSFFREFCATLPDEVMLCGGLVPAPDGSGAKLAVILGCHCGSLADGEAALEPLKSFGSPVVDALGPIPYSVLNSMLDAGFPKGALSFWKSQFLRDLSDDAVTTMIERFAACGPPTANVILEHFHGQATRVPIADTACTLRQPGFNAVLASLWSDRSDSDRCISWTRETFTALQPFLGTTRYVNYLGDDEPGDVVAQTYGPNYQRLRQLKTKYDPENVFHVNMNIKPL